jgi:hypothetical protein
MNDQKKECGCVSNDLLIQLIQSNQQLAKTMEAQNKVMAQIIDQNSELMARYDEDLEDKTESVYLDGSI